MFRPPWCTFVYLCWISWALLGSLCPDPEHLRQKSSYREQGVSAPWCRQDPSSAPVLLTFSLCVALANCRGMRRIEGLSGSLTPSYLLMTCAVKLSDVNANVWGP